MKNTLKKDERLKKRNEFKNVFDNGKIFKDSNIIAYFLSNKLKKSRLGIVVKKKLGNAIKRNRIKRLFREAFRDNKWQITQCIDIIVMPRSNTKEITLLSANNFLKDFISYIKR